jgi:hypothetical protein
MAEPRRAGWIRYIKEAFTYRWNVLVFGGAAVAALLSPSPDVALPLVAAAEIVYLGGLTTLPRFQGAIDAKARAETRGGAAGPEPVSVRQQLVDVMGGLDPERRNRFLRLRARAVEMQRIANAVRGDTRDASGAAAELRTPALDRMLWVFLRLLLSAQALERFVRAADGSGLAKNLADLEAREKAAESKPETERDERILRSLRDSIATARLRLDNYQKAQSNAEYISVELDRIENKIQALTEMAVSHQDPDVISAQVDAVAEGISQTEATIRELQNITGLSAESETPAILDADLTVTQR